MSEYGLVTLAQINIDSEGYVPESMPVVSLICPDDFFGLVTIHSDGVYLVGLDSNYPGTKIKSHCVETYEVLPSIRDLLKPAGYRMQIRFAEKINIGYALNPGFCYRFQNLGHFHVNKIAINSGWIVFSVGGSQVRIPNNGSNSKEALNNLGYIVRGTNAG